MRARAILIFFKSKYFALFPPHPSKINRLGFLYRTFWALRKTGKSQFLVLDRTDSLHEKTRAPLLFAKLDFLRRLMQAHMRSLLVASSKGLMGKPAGSL